MKKNLIVVLLAVFTLAMLMTAAVSADPIKIGVIQLVEHSALDSAYQGFVDGLAEAGFVDGDTIEIDFQNAQNDQSNMVTISDRFVNNDVDLILAIATPAAQAVASATTDIPILVTAVTDLVGARLVESNEVPGTNVSGTNDMQPIEAQVEFLQQLFPDAKTIGILFNSSEANSQIQVDLMTAACEAAGLEVETGTVTSVNDIEQVANSMISDIDVIMLPTDNTIASAMPNLVMVAEENQIPIIAGEPGMVESGALATVGIDYYMLGKQTAAMAVKVLNGEAEPATMPVESLALEDATMVVNTTTAEAIGFEVPADVLEKATLVE